MPFLDPPKIIDYLELPPLNPNPDDQHITYQPTISLEVMQNPKFGKGNIIALVPFQNSQKITDISRELTKVSISTGAPVDKLYN